MRLYIFTRAEQDGLIEWLKGGEETALVTETLSRIRNANLLAAQIELFALALRKLKQEGRLMGRLKLPSELASRASSLSAASSRKRSGKST